MEHNNYIYRFIARIVIEATTPIAVASGETAIFTDSPVAKDVNGLPYVPGTAIAGILRHALGVTRTDHNELWGFQASKEGHGSALIFSDAHIVGADGIAVDGLKRNVFADDFLKEYQILPVRQHVRISHSGVAEDAGKFDEEIVYKGTRFCFDIEMAASSADGQEQFNDILDKLCSNTLRVGGGTRKGFGLFSVHSCKILSLDLSLSDQLKQYQDYSPSLSSEYSGSEYIPQNPNSNVNCIFDFTIQPRDFFLFGSGLGDDDADMTFVKEKYVKWDSNSGSFVNEEGVLIPATSIKGALAHRVAYYYNKENNIFADKLDDLVEYSKVENPAVVALFGSVGASNTDISTMIPGKVFINDVFLETETCEPKILNHVSIDRFTGGALDGALFSERVVYAKDQKINVNVYVDNTIDRTYLKYLESAISDIKNGLLPLGGGASRGNGFFHN